MQRIQYFEVEYLKLRGKEVLLLNNELFSKSGSDEDGIIYSCRTRRTTGCKARVHVSQNEGLTVLNETHIHEPTGWKKRQQELEQDMFALLFSDPNLTYKQIYDRVMNNESDFMKEKIKFKSTSAKLSQKKRGRQPLLPTTFAEIEKGAKSYAPTRNLTVCTVAAEDGSLATLITTKKMLEKLATCEEILISSSRLVNPEAPISEELIVIHVTEACKDTEDKILRCEAVFILVERNSEELMCRVFFELALRVRSLQANLKRVWTPMDKNIVCALNDMFPDAKLRTTFFDYKKVVSEIFEKEDVKLPHIAVRMLWNAPLLPFDEFVRSTDLIENEVRRSANIRDSEFQKFQAAMAKVHTELMTNPTKIWFENCTLEETEYLEEFDIKMRVQIKLHPPIFFLLLKIKNALIKREKFGGTNVLRRYNREWQITIAGAQKQRYNGHINEVQFLKRFEDHDTSFLNKFPVGRNLQLVKSEIYLELSRLDEPEKISPNPNRSVRENQVRLLFALKRRRPLSGGRRKRRAAIGNLDLPVDDEANDTDDNHELQGPSAEPPSEEDESENPDGPSTEDEEPEGSIQMEATDSNPLSPSLSESIDQENAFFTDFIVGQDVDYGYDDVDKECDWIDRQPREGFPLPNLRPGKPSTDQCRLCLDSHADQKSLPCEHVGCCASCGNRHIANARLNTYSALDREGYPRRILNEAFEKLKCPVCNQQVSGFETLE